MGGLGSGGWNATGKIEVEAALRFDVMHAYRTGVLENGWRGGWQWLWPDGRRSWIKLHADRQVLHLRYTVRTGQGAPEQVHQVIDLDWTSCRLGGSRPWWRCPACGRRCAILHGLARFACRRCHGLVYGSQRERAPDRAMRRADRLRARLGGPSGFGQVPPRPKGMHGATYERHLERIFAADAEIDAHIETMIARPHRKR